jgi:ribonuclease PH
MRAARTTCARARRSFHSYGKIQSGRIAQEGFEHVECQSDPVPDCDYRRPGRRFVSVLRTLEREFMRIDKRQPADMRPVKITTDYLLTAEGSVLIEVGNTRVLCTASVEESVPPFLRNSGKGWVTAEYSMLPRATATRTPREVTKGRPSGRTMEIQRLIGRALRSVIDFDVLGERSILLDCDVLQADGGTRTAAITGAYIALSAAVRNLVKFGAVKRSPIRDFIAATSVGIVGGVPMLDLCYQEDSQADVDMNIVMTGAGRYVELQSTAEKTPFDDEQLAQLMALGRAGIAQLVEIQRGFEKAG